MGLLESIYGWATRFRPKLDRLPFDELARRYPREELEVWKEFVRRMNKIVFYAAEEYMQRTREKIVSEEVGEKAMQVFQEFAPQFGSGRTEMLLRRFAIAIRRVLDNEAFESIAHRYYYQLPIYYLEDEAQRRVMAACYESGLSPSIAKQISERFMITVDDANRIIKAGNRSLEEIITKDFTLQELTEQTEGYVRQA
jgi:hypothetical protein